MTPDTPSYTLATLTQPGRPKRGCGLVIALGAAGVVLVATVAVLATLLATSHGAAQKNPSAPVAPIAATTSAGTITIDGVLTLKIGEFTWNSTSDPTCYGIKGFTDLRGGAPVTVTDATGKALVVGALDTGNAFGISGDHAESCRLTFTVKQVPAGKGPYGLTVSHRDAGHYNESDLAGDVELAL